MNELAKQTPAQLAESDGMTTDQLANHFIKSGFFKDARDVSQAIVKIQAGRELGFGPMQSMMGIYIVDGKVTVGSQMMGACAIRAGYRYVVAESTDKKCTIVFHRGGERVGESTFTIEDAQRAGLTSKNNWKYPKAMLGHRAMAQGVRMLAPDSLGGVPVYDSEELEPLPPVAAEVIEDTPGAPAAAEQPPVDDEAIKAFKIELEQAANVQGWKDPEEYDKAFNSVLAKFGVTKIEATTEKQRARMLLGIRADGWKATRESMKGAQ